MVAQRRWVCIGVLLALFLGTRMVQSLAVPSSAAEGVSRVAIVRTGDHLEAAIREAVAQAGGLAGLIEPGDVVVIKVNLVMDSPHTSGMVTDPAVARTVVRLAREAGASQVTIAEGTAQYREGDPNRDRLCTAAAFRVAGYDLDGDMVDDATGVPLVDLNDSGGTDVTDPAKVTRVVVPAGLMRNEYWLPNHVLDADVFISVPVMKNHYLAGVTLGMKNLVGLLPNDLYHGPGNIYGKHSLSHIPLELDQHIVDANLARRPDFVVVDGQRGMVDGPIGSEVIDPPMGLILAGPDTVAVDTVGALVMGYDPRAIPYLAMAARAGLGTMQTNQIRIKGVPLDLVRHDFPAPYADSPARRCDAEPPVVDVAAPVESAPAGEVTFRVEASDNDALARVEFFLDGKRVGQSVTSPFEVVVDVGEHPAAVHTARAVAYDRCLNRSESSREVHFTLPTSTGTTVPPAASATAQVPTAKPVQPTISPTAAATSPSVGAVTPQVPVTPAPRSNQTARLSPTTIASPGPAVEPTATPLPTTTSILVAEAPAGAADSPVTEVDDTDPPRYPGWFPLVSGGVLVLLIAGLLGVSLGLYMSRRLGK
jgi:uncharacterized protein (DUF362 family)